MNIGNSDSIMEMDGGQLFGPITEIEWERCMVADRRNSAHVSVNMLLIQTPNGNLLIEGGRRQQAADILILASSYQGRGDELGSARRLCSGDMPPQAIKGE